MRKCPGCAPESLFCGTCGNGACEIRQLRGKWTPGEDLVWTDHGAAPNQFSSLDGRPDAVFLTGIGTAK
jgi:hypothetical protein